MALIDCVSLTAVCGEKQLDGKVLLIRHAVDGMMMMMMMMMMMIMMRLCNNKG